MMACDEDNRPMFECWSNDGVSGKPCRPCGIRRRQPCCYDDANASDTSLHSCHSDNALRQWTTATMCCPRPSCCPSVHCCKAAKSRKGRSTSAGDDNERRDGTSELQDAYDDNSLNCNYNRCTYMTNSSSSLLSPHHPFFFIHCFIIHD